MVWPFGSIVLLEPRRRGNIAEIDRNMGAADQIVDSISSTNNNNSNNDGEFDDDLKRVREVLESSKACVFSNPTFFLDKKIFPLPQNVHQKEALKKTSSRKKILEHRSGKNRKFCLCNATIYTLTHTQLTFHQ